MSVTWRQELYFECDGAGAYGTGCSEALGLDQLHAKTKRGMFAYAKKLGWSWNEASEGVRRAEKAWCPACTAKRRKTTTP